MLRSLRHELVVVAAALLPLVGASAWRPILAAAVVVPPFRVAAQQSTRAGSLDTAVVAGGCFWGVEAVFEHVRGVTRVVSGYAGGSSADADYERVSSGSTGHAESVQIVYDPSQISYGELLRIFFSIAHDPTQLNRQGPDVGTQYRSAIFYGDENQRRTATAYIEQITQAKTFSRPVVTQIVAGKTFYPAEAYHQDFAERNPDHPYIVAHDRPKVERLRKQLPSLYRDTKNAPSAPTKSAPTP